MSKSSGTKAIRIDGVDGPTPVFLLKRNGKLTLKQRIHKYKYNLKKFLIEKTLKTGTHSIDEVMVYLKEILGFEELDLACNEAKEEYEQMRASFILQHAPELLGEYAKMPELSGESEEEIRAYLKLAKEQMQRAMEVSKEDFDIDFHKFRKVLANKKGEIHFVIEKKYGYIGDGASGSRSVIRKLRHIDRKVFRYYGVSSEDITKKSERYKDVVRALCR